MPEARSRADLRLEGEPTQLVFEPSGDLRQVF
jgi:hypothetical protein